MKHDAQLGRQTRDILLSFTPLVEPLSLEEAFLDVRGCEGEFGPAPELGRQIKAKIKGETGLTASAGTAPHKFLAKLASDHGKPDGLVVLPPGKVTEFLAPLPVGRLWGVGAKGEQRLHALGTRTIGQLAALPERMLLERLGEAGRHSWQLAHGPDDRDVVPDRAAKSVSTETTFARDIGARNILRGHLLDLVDHPASRLRHAGLHARTVDVKIRFADFHTRARSVTIAEATNWTDPLGQAAAGLFERSLSRDMLPVLLARDPVVQRGLFDEEVREKQSAVGRAVGAIRGQFGRGPSGAAAGSASPTGKRRTAVGPPKTETRAAHQPVSPFSLPSARSVRYLTGRGAFRGVPMVAWGWKERRVGQETTPMKPEVGEAAPDVELRDDAGRLVRLSALRHERPLALLFVRHLG